MNSDYPQHTPELARLFKEMTDNNNAVKKLKTGLVFRTPEYAAAHKSYKAYWNAVDADRKSKELVAV